MKDHVFIDIFRLLLGIFLSRLEGSERLTVFKITINIFSELKIIKILILSVSFSKKFFKIQTSLNGPD